MKHEKTLEDCSLTRRTLLEQGALSGAAPWLVSCVGDAVDQASIDEAALRRAALPSQLAGIRIRIVKSPVPQPNWHAASLRRRCSITASA
jgi:hypothetical protein